MKKNFKDFFVNLKSNLNKALFPENITCDCCTRDIFSEQFPAICSKCEESLPIIINPCQKCGKPLNKNNKCKYCYFNRSSFTKAFSVFEYKEPISDMVFRFKYGKEIYLKNFFTFFLKHKFSNLNLNVDCVINVPMFKDKEVIRIKNQSALLVEEFCKQTNLTNASFNIEKIMATSQTTLDSLERFENVKSSIHILDKNYFKNKSILIIDDIFTTGATIEELANICRRAGAERVYFLTVTIGLGS